MELRRDIPEQFSPEAGDPSALMQKFAELKAEMDAATDKNVRAQILEQMKQTFQTAVNTTSLSEAQSNAFKEMSAALAAYEAALQEEK